MAFSSVVEHVILKIFPTLSQWKNVLLQKLKQLVQISGVLRIDFWRDSSVKKHSHKKRHLRSPSQSPVLDYGPQSPVLDYGPQSPVLDYGPQSPVLEYGPQSPVLDYGPQSPALDLPLVADPWAKVIVQIQRSK